MTPDTVSVTVRALGFVALFQAAGAVFFLGLFGDLLTRSVADIRRLGLLAASGGVVLVLTHLALDAARMADEFSGLWDVELQRRAWMSTNGAAHLLQAFGLLVVAAALRRVNHGRFTLAVAGAILTVMAFLLTGHTSVNTMRWLLAPLLAVHLMIVAFWFGALAPLYRVTQREVVTVAARVVDRFSAIAGWLVPCILLAGLGMAVVLVPDLSVLRRPYGLLLLGKVCGFGLLMALAAFNKWRLTPELSAGVAKSLRALRYSITAEFLLIVAVLGLTATLTAFYSPEN